MTGGDIFQIARAILGGCHRIESITRSTVLGLAVVDAISLCNTGLPLSSQHN
jgi:hypothetical protein